MNVSSHFGETTSSALKKKGALDCVCVRERKLLCCQLNLKYMKDSAQEKLDSSSTTQQKLVYLLAESLITGEK